MGQDFYLDYVGKKTSILHQCEIHANPPERERTSQEAGVALACDFVYYVCLSVHRGVQVYIPPGRHPLGKTSLDRHPPRQTSPWADTPWVDTTPPPRSGRHSRRKQTPSGRHPPGRHPPGQTPSPQADTPRRKQTPPRQTSPWADTPRQTPPGQTPPRQNTPPHPHDHCSEQYSSYWNAFLLSLLKANIKIGCSVKPSRRDVVLF